MTRKRAVIAEPAKRPRGRPAKLDVHKLTVKLTAALVEKAGRIGIGEDGKPNYTRGIEIALERARE